MADALANTQIVRDIDIGTKPDVESLHLHALKYIGVLGGDVHQSATDGRVEMFAQARAHR